MNSFYLNNFRYLKDIGFFMEKIKITKVDFIPTRTEGSFIGFANITLWDWLDLNGLGIHKNLDSIKLTLPAKKLRNGQMKFYYFFNSPEIQEQIRQAVEKEIEESGIWQVKFKQDEEE